MLATTDKFQLQLPPHSTTLLLPSPHHIFNRMLTNRISNLTHVSLYTINYCFGCSEHKMRLEWYTSSTRHQTYVSLWKHLISHTCITGILKPQQQNFFLLNKFIKWKSFYVVIHTVRNSKRISLKPQHNFLFN